MRVRSYQAMEAAQPAVTETASSSASSVGAPAPGRAFSEDDLTTSASEGGHAHTDAVVETTNTISREQRYRELLAMGNSPQDAAVKTAAEIQAAGIKAMAPKPQPQASAVSRPLQPAVNAAGQKPGATPPPSGQKQSTPPNSDTPKKVEDPKDPNSDTTPPQLLSIEFQPPQIQDGGETVLIITAQDDMSGIRGISGTLTSPTGKALQGFAQQRDGETNRYISHITIPKDAEEGTWKISF